MQGVPALICRKCGEYLYAGLHNQTWSKKDIEKASKLTEGRTKPRTKEEIMKEIAEREDRKRRMNESIARYVKERMDLI